MNEVSFKCGLFEFHVKAERIALGLLIVTGLLLTALYIDKVYQCVP
jgi:hypothetical protein